jgi:hypothetical protein
MVPQASGLDTRTELRARAKTRSKRVRRLGLLVLTAAIVLPILVLAFDEGEPVMPVPVPQATRLLPGGPPASQIVALEGTLRIAMPIAQSKVTAVGYHAVGDGALALEPVGTQANAGVFTRLLRRLFGQDRGGIRYYLIDGGSGAETGGLDIGAPPGTDVYSPVDGIVIGLTENVISGRTYGVRADVQPSGSPGLVLSIENLEPDPVLTVGSSVAASRTKLGTVLDLSSVETAALARYTQDSGQHVHIEVRPSGDITLP